MYLAVLDCYPVIILVPPPLPFTDAHLYVAQRTPSVEVRLMILREHFPALAF